MRTFGRKLAWVALAFVIGSGIVIAAAPRVLVVVDVRTGADIVIDDAEALFRLFTTSEDVLSVVPTEGENARYRLGLFWGTPPSVDAIVDAGSGVPWRLENAGQMGWLSDFGSSGVFMILDGIGSGRSSRVSVRRVSDEGLEVLARHGVTFDGEAEIEDVADKLDSRWEDEESQFSALARLHWEPWQST